MKYVVSIGLMEEKNGQNTRCGAEGTAPQRERLMQKEEEVLNTVPSGPCSAYTIRSKVCGALAITPIHG